MRLPAQIACALLLLSASRADAQNVSDLRGRVIDSITGQPLADAIVRLPGLRRYTLTNASGNFVISGVPRGGQSVEVMQLGYREVLRHIQVLDDSVHIFRLVAAPIRLDSLIVADTRQLQRRMNSAAKSRAHDMGRFGGPMFWRSWDRESILKSGIAAPIDFLRRGQPRLVIRACSGMGQPRDRLCLNSGSSRYATVYLDDRRISAIEDLRAYTMDDFHRVETYGFRGERGIRLYTEGYLRLVAAGVITPDRRIEPDVFEIRRDGDGS